MGTAQPAGGMTTRILAAAFGAIVAMAVAGCQLSDDDSGPVDEIDGAQDSQRRRVQIHAPKYRSRQPGGACPGQPS